MKKRNQEMVGFVLFLLAHVPTVASWVGDEIYHYEMKSTTEEKMEINKTVLEVANLALCSVHCSQMKHYCNAFRYNLPSPKSCQLGTHRNENDFDPVFDPGDFPTYWKIRFSKDRCLMKFHAQTAIDAARDFCKDMNGQLPEMRRISEDVTAIKQTGKWTSIGLRQDSLGVWRWDSDGAVSDIIPIVDERYDEDGPCARIKDTTDIVYTSNCSTIINFACQFC